MQWYQACNFNRNTKLHPSPPHNNWPSGNRMEKTSEHELRCNACPREKKEMNLKWKARLENRRTGYFLLEGNLKDRDIWIPRNNWTSQERAYGPRTEKEHWMRSQHILVSVFSWSWWTLGLQESRLAYLSFLISKREIMCNNVLFLSHTIVLICTWIVKGFVKY